MIAKVKQIETLGSLDGPGIRTVIFFQGCPLRCIFCHNPEMWNTNDQAKEFTPEELFDLIRRYKSYYGTNGGVTFSGGESLLQASFLQYQPRRQVRSLLLEILQGFPLYAH